MNKSKYSLFACLFLLASLVALAVNKAHADTKPTGYVYADETDQLLINNGVVYHIDESGGLSAEEASRQDFSQIAHDIPNLGIQSSPIWLKFQLTNRTAQENLLLMVEQPSLDLVSLHVVKGDIVEHIATMGEQFRFSDRIYTDNPNYLFPIPIKPGETADILIMVRSADQIQLPIFVGTEQGILGRYAINSLLFGIYLGIMGIMVVYNFFLYVSVRDTAYLYYIAFIIFVGLSQALFKGYTFQYLWPNSPWLALNSSVLIPVASGLTTGLFTKRFLQVRRYFRQHDVGINIFMLCYGVGLVIGLVFSVSAAVQLIQVCAMGGSVYLLIVAEKIRRKRSRAAFFYLIAYFAFLVSVVVFVLRNFNVVPYNAFTANILELGSTVLVTLLSFALADRINTYRKEKEESQIRAITIAKENERLIREQNIVLEHRVEERTSELQEANQVLQQTLTNLKETQAQLVESEKMASLGQLTAGVAHEINNPINFVTSNVGPLKRDVAMLWDALAEAERIGLSEMSLEEKQQVLEAYKEEMDLEYLKVEIEFLLKGMHEGASRTAEIVKSMRIFSRVDEDVLKYADINEGLQSTLVILNTVIRGALKVETSWGELPEVECYPGKLNQVFLNLITNGVYAINEKYGNESGGLLLISTKVEGENAHITIADNGIGMSKDVLERIFEPFFTTKEVGEGTGLGMSIVYNTIKKHNGEVLIDSEEGRGTTFVLIIPLKQEIQ